MSNLRGVVKDGFPKMALGVEGGGCEGIPEKRNGCEFGSRRAGVSFLLGESKML